VSPAGAALIPAFSLYTSTADGFTFQISNYNPAFIWAGTATNGGSVNISASGFVTVSALGVNTASVATISTTQNNYAEGSTNTDSIMSLTNSEVANIVIALISNFDWTNARIAYDLLTSTQQGLVTNYAELTTHETFLLKSD